MKRIIIALMMGMTAVVYAGSVIAPVASVPTVGGGIGGVGEGYTVLTEDAHGRLGPGLGGSTVNSDLFNESASFHWWDGAADHAFSSARGDLKNIHVAYDANNLYIGVVAGTAPFNSWGDAGGNNDQGDLYIALDAADGTAGGNRSSAAGFNGFAGDTAGQKAVDFENWNPTHVIGLQWYDNGGGGGGYAEIEKMSDHSHLGIGQGGNNAGFGWDASFQGGDGHYEFSVAWSVLGVSSPLAINDFRLNAYMTQNDAGWDVYDSAYGFGQGTGQFYEEIGDHPLDPDNSGDGLGAGDAGQFGVPANSFPGSNFVGIDGDVDQNDGIDSIGGYLSFATIPEPGTIGLIAIGFGLTSVFRRPK